MRMRLALAALAALMSAGAARAQFADVDAPTKAACRAVASLQPPAGDRPAPADAAALKGCRSEALYYGEGRAPDMRGARLCAFQEEQAAPSDRTDGPFSGAAVLMQIYANGRGVSRNPDLALHYACAVDGAPAEIEGRVAHLLALKAKPSGPPFDYCDDITSGLADGFCERRAAALRQGPRAAALAAYAARLPPVARPAFQALRAASHAFIARHGEGEVDLSGTSRAAFVIAEEEKSRDRFAAHLRTLAAGRWPPATAAEAQAADAALNSSYRAVLAALAGKNTFTTVRPEGVRAAQRAWLAYRDAFLRFSAAAAPGTGRDAVAAVLIRERTEALKALTP